ncbi:MAG: N-acetylmuramoyl-L-alanine amidase, partial [Marinicella sp.]
QWVDPKRIAHHVKGHNKQSIGIELVNTGRYPDWHHSQNQIPTEHYPDVQITGLIKLINHLHKNIPSLKHIAGHEDLDQTMIASSDDDQIKVHRKVDPGVLFPWSMVMTSIQLINIGSTAKKYE